MTVAEEYKHLLRRVQNGETAALAEVVDGLRSRIASLARYYASRTSEVAGDLEQEAWVAILEALPHVRPDVGDPRQYLIKVGRWRLLNFLDEQAARRHEEIPDGYEEEVPAEAPARAATRCLLDRIFERVSDRQAVILRALMAGHTSAEIARLLGCTTANVAWHVRRIRDVYRELQGAPHDASTAAA